MTVFDVAHNGITMFEDVTCVTDKMIRSRGGNRNLKLPEMFPASEAVERLKV